MRITKSTIMSRILTEPVYDEYIGHDTRPYFKSGRTRFYLPVASRNAAGVFFDSGDVLGALRDAPMGTVLVCPGYYGIAVQYIRSEGGWELIRV